MNRRLSCCLVTAIGSLASDAVIAGLRRQETRVIGCSIHPGSWTAATSDVDVFCQIPNPSDVEAYTESLIGLCAQENISHIVPLTDVEVDVLEENRERFSARGITLCMQDSNANHVCRDKWAVFERFRDDPSVTPIVSHLMDDVAADGVFPALAKPRHGRSSEGLVTLDGPADLAYYRDKFCGKGYIVQPRLDGVVHVTDIVRNRQSGVCATVTRRELTRTSNGAGLAVQILAHGKIDEIAICIAQALDIHGCINIEHLVDGDRVWLMDINPRFSAGVVFSKLAGYDMVTQHFRCFTGEDIEAPIEPLLAIHTRRYVEVTCIPSLEPCH